MKRLPAIVLMAGAMPILAVHLAYGLNIKAGLEGCNPYWEGCISVSRAASSGPGRVIACIEDPQLIAKILGHVRARDEAAGMDVRAPPGCENGLLTLV